MIGGWAISTTYAVANTLIITTIPNEFRGRIMSIYMFVFMGGMPSEHCFQAVLFLYMVLA